MQPKNWINYSSIIFAICGVIASVAVNYFEMSKTLAIQNYKIEVMTSTVDQIKQLVSISNKEQDERNLHFQEYVTKQLERMNDKLDKIAERRHA